MFGTFFLGILFLKIKQLFKETLEHAQKGDEINRFSLKSGFRPISYTPSCTLNGASFTIYRILFLLRHLLHREERHWKLRNILADIAFYAYGRVLEEQKKEEKKEEKNAGKIFKQSILLKAQAQHHNNIDFYFLMLQKP